MTTSIPQQARSRETQERLLNAALELIVERGPEMPSVPQIAERAGVSVGAFYGRFASKEALFDLLDERMFEEATDCWVEFFQPEAWEDADLAEVISDWVNVLVDVYSTNLPLTRAVTLNWRSHPPSDHVRGVATHHYRELADALGRLLEERQDEMDHPDPRSAALFLLETTEAVLTERLVLADSHLVPLQLSKKRLKDELGRLTLGYLQTATLERGSKRPRRKLPTPTHVLLWERALEVAGRPSPP